MHRMISSSRSGGIRWTSFVPHWKTAIAAPIPALAGFAVEGFTGLDFEFGGRGTGAVDIRVANSDDPGRGLCLLSRIVSGGGRHLVRWPGPAAVAGK